MEQKKQHETQTGHFKESQELLKMIRVYLLDELVYHNGKQLNPDLIGEITGKVIDNLKVYF
jgi:hypothetical protein